MAETVKGAARMVELLRTGDPVLLSYVSALLSDAGITSAVWDRHMGAAIGGVLPSRVMVADGEIEIARKLLAEAGLSCGS